LPATRLPCRVTADEPLAPRVEARTEGRGCDWYVEPERSGGDDSGALRTGDGGRPFRAGGTEGRPGYGWTVGETAPGRAAEEAPGDRRGPREGSPAPRRPPRFPAPPALMHNRGTPPPTPRSPVPAPRRRRCAVSLKLTIDPDAPAAPYEQVRAQIAEQARGGVLPVGHRLPTVRALAGELGLAVNTVAKAYRALETDGVIETRGRHGTFVAAAGDAAAREAAAAARTYAQRVRRLGLDRAAALTAVEDALSAEYARDPAGAEEGRGR